MSAVENINPEKEPVPRSWVPQVITGGKEPPDGGGPITPGENWLEKLPVGTMFAARPNVNTVDWEMYFLRHKHTNVYLLNMETPDGKIWERRVDPKVFCKHYRDYEEIAYYPQQEAPKGDDDGSNRECNSDHP